MINKRVSSIENKEITEFFQNSELNLKDTIDKKEVYKSAEYIVIATFTEYVPIGV